MRPIVIHLYGRVRLQGVLAHPPFTATPRGRVTRSWGTCNATLARPRPRRPTRASEIPARPSARRLPLLAAGSGRSAPIRAECAFRHAFGGCTNGRRPHLGGTRPARGGTA